MFSREKNHVLSLLICLDWDFIDNFGQGYHAASTQYVASADREGHGALPMYLGAEA